MKTTYEQEAEEALQQAGGAISIVLTDEKTAPWEDDGRYRPHYRVTLKGPGGRYTFDFWGSVNDGATGKKATAYDVLACLGWFTPDTFQDFCAEFGYDEDSRKAEKTWKACVKQSNALKRSRIFTKVETPPGVCR